MPWKVTQPVCQRMLFIAEHVAQEKSVAELCRQYGISRKTGYKWIKRVVQDGEAGLHERSSAPHHCAHRLDPRQADQILALRAQHPTWGPRKLRFRLARLHPEHNWPAHSTIGELLRRHGLVAARRRRRQASPTPTPLTAASAANQVWSVDFKGHFRTSDGLRCTPLTVLDAYSRFLLGCVGLTGCTGLVQVQPLFAAIFRNYGLPAIIRSDNGPPFASTGLAGLTRLSVWWHKLGIIHERIEPGHPEQNGSHERMHRTLKAETANPPAATGRAQQLRFVQFGRIYNYERPHEGIGMATPAELYLDSPRPYPAPPVEPVAYPHGWLVRKVKNSGRIKWGGRVLHLTDALTGEHVGLAPAEEDGWWDIYFGTMLVAHLDETRMMIVPCETEG